MTDRRRKGRNGWLSPRWLVPLLALLAVGGIWLAAGREDYVYVWQPPGMACATGDFTIMDGDLYCRGVLSLRAEGRTLTLLGGGTDLAWLAYDGGNADWVLWSHTMQRTWTQDALSVPEAYDDCLLMDDRMLFVADGVGGLSFTRIDPRTGEELRWDCRFFAPDIGACSKLCWDGTHLLLGFDGGTVGLYDWEKNSVTRLTGEQEPENREMRMFDLYSDSTYAYWLAGYWRPAQPQQWNKVRIPESICSGSAMK